MMKTQMSEPLAVAYERLRRIANKLMLRERVGHTLGAADVVHEAWLRLLGAGCPPDHLPPVEFIRRCSRAMVEVLIDYARARKTEKRGGRRLRVQFEELNDIELAMQTDDLNWQELRHALTELEQLHPKRHSIVTMRFFAGMQTSAIAEQLQLDESTVRRAWLTTQQWLRNRLSAA